jgi:hypothetical protein
MRGSVGLPVQTRLVGHAHKMAESLKATVTAGAKSEQVKQ